MRTTVSLAAAVLTALLITIPLIASADDNAPAPPPQQVNDIDQRLRVLERLRELDDEAAKAAKEANPGVFAGREGFVLKSAKGDYVLRIRGLLYVDGRMALDDKGAYTNAFVPRSVRPSIEGTIDRVIDFRFLPDFGSGTVQIQDAYLELKFRDALRLRAGKTKAPFGLERLMGEAELWFLERGYPTQIATNRDVGLVLNGQPHAGAIDYALALTNGTPDGGSVDTDFNDGKDVTARLFVLPLGKRTGDYAAELGIGLAANWGRQSGTTAASTGLSSYRTPGQVNFFSYRASASSADSTTRALGSHYRLSPQARFTQGRLALLGEYAVSKTAVRRIGITDRLRNQAWQVAGTWVLTGESASFKNVRPRYPFDPARDHWGALELAARFNEFKADDGSFSTFANPASSAQRARSWTVGLNTYLTERSKWQLNWEKTDFKGGAAGGQDRRPEKLLSTRFQLSI